MNKQRLSTQGKATVPNALSFTRPPQTHALNAIDIQNINMISMWISTINLNSGGNNHWQLLPPWHTLTLKDFKFARQKKIFADSWEPERKDGNESEKTWNIKSVYFDAICAIKMAKWTPKHSRQKEPPAFKIPSTQLNHRSSHTKAKMSETID